MNNHILTPSVPLEGKTKNLILIVGLLLVLSVVVFGGAGAGSLGEPGAIGSQIVWDKISSINILDEKQHVYDLVIEGTHSFMSNEGGDGK